LKDNPDVRKKIDAELRKHLGLTKEATVAPVAPAALPAAATATARAKG
jgi:hypothetical protein